MPMPLTYRSALRHHQTIVEYGFRFSDWSSSGRSQSSSEDQVLAERSLSSGELNDQFDSAFLDREQCYGSKLLGVL